MPLHPKDLNKMKVKIAENLDGPSEQAASTRELIDNCQLLEKQLAQEPVRMLTIDQAAERLGVSKQTLRNWEQGGKVVCIRTDGGHRRYREDHINELRRKQASMMEILLPGVTPNKLRELGEMLVSSFGPEDRINLSISQGAVDGRVRIVIDSEDGLTTVVKTFNVKD
jgi:excisionase family DNA binding protein